MVTSDLGTETSQLTAEIVDAHLDHAELQHLLGFGFGFGFGLGLGSGLGSGFGFGFGLGLRLGLG